MDSYISENIFEDLLIAIGGIFFQLLLALILKVTALPNEDLINSYNMMLIAFNLVPVCPLDGYKILKYLEELLIPFKHTFLLSFIISILVITMFFLFSIDTIAENTLVFMFLIISTIEEFKNKKYILNRFYLERLHHTFVFPLKAYITKKSNMYKNRHNIIIGKDEQKFLQEEYDQLLKAYDTA